MASQKRSDAAEQTLQGTQQAARDERTISRLSSAARAALARERAKAAARKREANTGPKMGPGALTVAQLRREAARRGIGVRSQMGKAQLTRAVGQPPPYSSGD